MRNSLYFKSFIATALIVLISFSLLGGLASAFNYRQIRADKRAMMISTLQETSRYITTQHIYYDVDLDDLNLSMWLAMTSGVTGFDLMVTDVNGVVESCSEKAFMNLGMLVPADILQVASNNENTVMMSSLGQIYSERRQVACTPLYRDIIGGTRIFGYLFVTSDMSVFRQEWQAFSSVFILIALNVMLFAFVITFLATKKQAEPLNEMASAARRFARGDFSARVKARGKLDEIGQLTEAFNAMADSLESYEQHRRDFIANLSHELKTPMTVIAGFAEGLLDGTIPRKDETRYLKVISLETKRLSRLVKSMVDMSTLRPTNNGALLESSFDISEVVRLALLSLDMKIEEKRLDVETSLPEEAIMTRGDGDSITQVIYNLIDNAIKFSGPGGVIGLELWKRGNRAYVSVLNQGKTIPPDELPHIFDRFHKADRSRGVDREGVGLGLYIVKTILDNHNEDIFVTSSGGYTKFLFSLTVV
jgi:signal transduction histidine kinase